MAVGDDGERDMHKWNLSAEGTVRAQYHGITIYIGHGRRGIGNRAIHGDNWSFDISASRRAANFYDRIGPVNMKINGSLADVAGCVSGNRLQCLQTFATPTNT